MLAFPRAVALVLLSVACAEAELTSRSKHTTGSKSSILNPLEHLGGQSPYFSAPSQYGIAATLPAGCHIDQASYLMRHGARYPTTGSYGGWINLYNKIQNTSFTAVGPLAFLPTWVPPLDDAMNQEEMLSGIGAAEAFDLGVALRHLGLTPGGHNFTVWSASQPRVVDTAQQFLDGYLAQGHYGGGSNLGHIVSMADSVKYTYANSLTATNGCNAFKENTTLASNFRAAYKPAIATRLNKYLTGLSLDVTDIGEMMDLCGFQTEISGFSPFCSIFTNAEWELFEYAQDLQFYYGSGPGYKLAGTSFWPYLRAVTDLFLVGPGNTTPGSPFIPPPLLMAFSHDNDISPLIAALGIFNETTLDPTRPSPARKFRSSYAISFGGRVALERLACAPVSQTDPSSVRHLAHVVPRSPAYSSYVRVKVNDAVVPLPGCTNGPGSSCSLGAFSNTAFVDPAAVQ